MHKRIGCTVVEVKHTHTHTHPSNICERAWGRVKHNELKKKKILFSIHIINFSTWYLFALCAVQHNRGQTCSRNEFLIRVDSQQRHAKGEMPFNHYISDCWFSTMKIHVSFCTASSRGSRPKYESDLSSFINSRLHSSSLPVPTFRIVHHSFCIMMPNQYLQTSFRFHIAECCSYDECDPIENPSHHRTWTLISNQLNDFLILLPRTNYTSLENQCMWM